MKAAYAELAAASLEVTASGPAANIDDDEAAVLVNVAWDALQRLQLMSPHTAQRKGVAEVVESLAIQLGSIADEWGIQPIRSADLKAALRLSLVVPQAVLRGAAEAAAEDRYKGARTTLVNDPRKPAAEAWTVAFDDPAVPWLDVHAVDPETGRYRLVGRG